MNWKRQMPMSRLEGVANEQWIREENDSSETFDVQVFPGKKTDLLGLKKNIVESIRSKQEYYSRTRKEIYQPENLEKVDKCPVCGSSSSETSLKANIYGAEYASCNECTHVYVLQRPTKTAIEGFYLNDVTYAATYTDKVSAESRLNTIAVPWLEWTVNLFEKIYGRKPTKILDVGSGAGHFVEACRRAGIQADGIELSESSRKFSKEIWDIELDGRDFFDAAKDYEGYEIVTFWGLLEHTPNPSKILETAHQIISKSDTGLVISKVPRWESLSAAIQQLKTDTIIRHLDPMGHIMCFTDESAAELYFKNKLSPVAAWYYGMDVYETFMQLGSEIDNFDVLTKTGNIQLELQQFVDEMRFSDGLTLAGVPVRA
jgi:transcription elongation factor Elf1